MDFDKFDADIILGADFMSHMKVTQDFENKTINFKENSEPQWLKKQIKVVNKSFMPDIHHIKVKCKIETPDNMILRPGQKEMQ